jgi:tetratricopeptide (TPR) repeat protein
VAIHEYVHLLVDHAGLKLPLWLNEGLAEYYSTLEPRGSKVLAGKLPPGRRELLLIDKWTPLEVVFGVDHGSEHYRDPKLAPRFYSQSWALVHMLTLEEEYRPGFARLVQELAGGASEAAAFQKVYGKTVDAIEKDVERYYRGDVFHGALFDIEMKRVRAEKKLEAVAEYDAAVLLATIGDVRGREAATRSKLEDLIARAPERPEAYKALGYLLWRSRDAGAAREHFLKAFELGDRSPRLLWDGGRLGGEKSTAMLELLVQRDPERVEARLELAAAQLRDRRGPAAVTTLAPVKKVTPNEAARLFQLTAYANWQTGQLEQAKVAAGRWHAVREDGRGPGGGGAVQRTTGEGGECAGGGGGGGGSDADGGDAAANAAERHGGSGGSGGAAAAVADGAVRVSGLRGSDAAGAHRHERRGRMADAG